MSGTWKVSGLMESLPSPEAPAEQPTGTEVQGQWAKPKGYDYTAMDGPERNTYFESNVNVYEWDGEEGDVGPQHPELELELFGKPENRHETKGLDFTAYGPQFAPLCSSQPSRCSNLGLHRISKIDVVQEGPVKIDLIQSFQDAGLHPAMLENVKLAGYEVPTPIQKCTLPSIQLGHDTIGIAQTGSLPFG